MHEGQVRIEAETVAALVADQFPELAGLAVVPLHSSGTVNAIFRIGDSAAARFPLVAEDDQRQVLRTEAAAAAEFASIAPVAAPVPLGIGAPGDGYPLPWTLQTWIDGTDATNADPAASDAFAAELARLISTLRSVDPAGRTFEGSGRGGHLPDHDEWMAYCFAQSASLVEVAPLRTLWDHLRTLPEIDPDAMCHGDLTPPNVLIRDGRLAGILDTGGFGPADPALDLVSVWHLLDAARRDIVRQRLGCGDIQWERGRAWALQQAMGLVWYYTESNPSMAAWGRRTLDRIVEN